MVFFFILKLWGFDLDDLNYIRVFNFIKFDILYFV